MFSSIYWIPAQLHFCRLSVPYALQRSTNLLETKCSNKRYIAIYKYTTMTYKELLYDLADRTAETYNSYLESKVSSLVDPDQSAPERTEQHRSEYERLEKKLIALLATVKNEASAEDEAPADFYEDFIKE